MPFDILARAENERFVTKPSILNDSEPTKDRYSVTFSNSLHGGLCSFQPSPCNKQPRIGQDIQSELSTPKAFQGRGKLNSAERADRCEMDRGAVAPPIRETRLSLRRASVPELPSVSSDAQLARGTSVSLVTMRQKIYKAANHKTSQMCSHCGRNGFSPNEQGSCSMTQRQHACNIVGSLFLFCCTDESFQIRFADR